MFTILKECFPQTVLVIFIIRNLKITIVLDMDINVLMPWSSNYYIYCIPSPRRKHVISQYKDTISFHFYIYMKFLPLIQSPVQHWICPHIPLSSFFLSLLIHFYNNTFLYFQIFIKAASIISVYSCAAIPSTMDLQSMLTCLICYYFLLILLDT